MTENIWKLRTSTDLPIWLPNYTRIEELMTSEAIADIYTSDAPIEATKGILKNLSRHFEVRQRGKRIYIRDVPPIHYDPYDTPYNMSF